MQRDAASQRSPGGCSIFLTTGHAYGRAATDHSDWKRRLHPAMGGARRSVLFSSRFQLPNTPGAWWRMLRFPVAGRRKGSLAPEPRSAFDVGLRLAQRMVHQLSGGIAARYAIAARAGAQPTPFILADEPIWQSDTATGKFWPELCSAEQHDPGWQRTKRRKYRPCTTPPAHADGRIIEELAISRVALLSY